MAWGRIRRLASAADANLDDFLHRTVVLTPEKLAIGLRKVQVADDTVIEVQPTFEGAPENWLERFDRQASVQSRYDIPTAQGIVQVVIGSKVRTVLEEIKRIPHRRVAGARAQAFILNPYAALGEDANSVIDEQQFESAREAAGLEYERFLPQFERDGLGYPAQVGLLVEAASSSGPVSSEVVWLDDGALAKFIKALKVALARNHQLLAWEGYDLELQGDSPSHLIELERALEERRRPQVLISYAQVYDLTHYASRVQEIGFEKPYYSPYIAKKQDADGWFPENLVNIISWVPEGENDIVSMPLSQEAVADLKQKVSVAKAAGKTEVNIPGYLSLYQWQRPSVLSTPSMKRSAMRRMASSTRRSQSALRPPRSNARALSCSPTSRVLTTQRSAMPPSPRLGARPHFRHRSIRPSSSFRINWMA